MFQYLLLSCCNPHELDCVWVLLIDCGSSAEDRRLRRRAQLTVEGAAACRGHKVDALLFVCVCSLFSATPTHHHGHSCLRLRVYVCCSTGETQQTLVLFFKPFPPLFCATSSPHSPLFPSHGRAENPETKRGTDGDREREGEREKN